MFMDDIQGDVVVEEQCCTWVSATPHWLHRSHRHQICHHIRFLTLTLSPSS